MKRFLGIDYGEKRIGVALSDEGGRFAFPHRIIKSGYLPDVVKEIQDVAKRNAVTQIVIGHSLSFDRTENEIMKNVRNLGYLLEEEGFDVYLHDETLTSAQARRSGQGGYVDASAAAILLQSYLDLTHS